MVEPQSVQSATPVLVILITGHPATGKTTFAYHLARELNLPLLCRDQIKETLLDHLDRLPGEEATAWSRRLGALSWILFYQQIETLLRASVAHVVESNFDPAYANARWQAFAHTYLLRLVQIRCESEPETLLARYQARIASDERHPGHVDDADNPTFLATIRQGPLPWIAVAGQRLVLDTTHLAPSAYPQVARTLANRLIQPLSTHPDE